MTRYVTEIYEPNGEPSERQVMHKYPMTEPAEAEAAQLGGSGPRPDQHQERNRSVSTATTWAPTRAELDEATARTAAAVADPSVSRADAARVAELEEKAHNAYLQRPGADAELQREAEAEWEAGG